MRESVALSLLNTITFLTAALGQGSFLVGARFVDALWGSRQSVRLLWCTSSLYPEAGDNHLQRGAVTTMKTVQDEVSEEQEAGSASERIDGRIRELGDWRGETLARVRALIRQADPEVVEEWKWRGVPVWSHGGILCTGETYQQVVKLTFAKGAALEDPAGLFNASLEGNTRRAIDLHEGARVDESAFKALIRAAVSLNASKGKSPN